MQRVRDILKGLCTKATTYRAASEHTAEGPYEETHRYSASTNGKLIPCTHVQSMSSCSGMYIPASLCCRSQMGNQVQVLCLMA